MSDSTRVIRDRWSGQYFNSLVVIESLSGELLTGKRITESRLTGLFEVEQHGMMYTAVRTASELDRDFLEIHERASRTVNPIIPIIHIEAHGLPDEGGLRLCDDPLPYSWRTLAKQLRLLNRRTGNNVLLVLACCHGKGALKSLIDVTRPAPFCHAICTEGEVTAGELESFVPFYESLATLHDLEIAVERHLPRGYGVYPSEHVLVETWIRLLCIRTTGKARAELLERELTRYNLSVLYPRPKRSLGELREILRVELKDDSDVYRRAYESMRDTFLLTSHPRNRSRTFMSYDDVLILARKRRNDETSGRRRSKRRG